jgi:hypothetical protein
MEARRKGLAEQIAEWRAATAALTKPAFSWKGQPQSRQKKRAGFTAGSFQIAPQRADQEVVFS